MSQKIAAIFGVGGRVGKAVALRFLENGYRVVAVSRSGATSLDEAAEKYKGKLRQYRADLSQPGEAVRVWKEIKKDHQSPISIVFYNAAASVPVPDGKIFDLSVETFRAAQETNTVSTFALAKEAIQDFAELPADVPKAFIYTGNGLDDTGKAASSIVINLASKVYGPLGCNFYYIDERTTDGKPALGNITGDGHADAVWKLSQDVKQSSWRLKFTNGKGFIE